MKLEDIAQKAGVSRSTVSRVINAEPYVSEQTRLRVMAIIEEEGFTPNPAARMLVTQRTRIIGVVIPQPLRDIFAADDPFYFSTLLQNIADVIQQQDYAMLLWMGHSDEDAARFHQRVLSNRLMDGLVIVSSMVSDEALLEKLLQAGIPFVLIGRPLCHVDRISCVVIDNVRAARQAVQHLYGLGRRRIGTITGNLDDADGEDRLVGYREGLEMLGLPVDPSLIVAGRFNREWGYVGMIQLLRRGVDAVFAGSDTIAMGAIKAIQEAGLRVPEDIAIVGFDDMPLAQQCNPQLTTIGQPVVEKAARAAKLLFDMIEGNAAGPVCITLPTQLVIRASCGYGNSLVESPRG